MDLSVHSNLPGPSRALIVVDMQNGFCHPDGSLPRLGMSLPGADAAVSAAAAAVQQARRAGMPVIFTRHQYRPGRGDEGRRLSELSSGLAGLNGLAAGSWDAEVMADLGLGPDDLSAIDLYSCFPAPVFNICDGLGLAPDDPRGLTVTGGLPSRHQASRS